MGESWEVRPEVREDAAAVRRVHQAAFSGDEEANLVAAFGVSGAATGAFVAVDDAGQVVGHLLFSPVAIDGPQGRWWAEGLAPLGVLPEFHGRGVGTALVRHGLDALVRARRRVVVVLGHPNYYARFGFREAAAFGLSWEISGHEAAFMVQALVPGALEGHAGIVRYRPEVMGFRVAPAAADRLGEIQALERLAASRFRGTRHAAVADAPPLSIERLEPLASVGGLWVVSSATHAVAAYIAWEPRASDAYVLEVDVHPDCAGARLGAALLDQVEVLARGLGLSRLLLRTFSDIPWNAPYYRRLGFHELSDAPTTLADVIQEEEALGLERSRRVTMSRAVRGLEPLF